MLFVERSNRTEKLLESLARRVGAPRADPLTPAIVVVQGPGMERWLAQRLARMFGVCANTELLFPRALLERVLVATAEVGGGSPDPRWEPASLAWWIASRLTAERDSPELAPLARHLSSVDGDWRLVQLAHHLAELFDRYVTDRPEQVIGWTEASSLPVDRDERWQAWLLRGLVDALGPTHLAARTLALVRHVRAAGGDTSEAAASLRAHLPERIDAFAVSTLSPLYLSLLDTLGQVVDVHLSILSPSRQYWADLWQELRDSDALDFGFDGADGAGLGEPVDGVEEAGARTALRGLLAGLGRLGADFQRRLEQEVRYHETEPDRFVDPVADGEAPSLLARLQTGLLDLGDRIDDRPIARDDDSLRVHLCHGPKRELEVLRSELRRAFDRDPSLRAEDVIVMAPMIDALAPTIEAVFGSISGEPAIPYRIADRGALRRSPVAEGFVALLELLTGRAGRSEVIDWLAHEPVRERFELDMAAVERIDEWAARAGIRFGLDAEHREVLGLARHGGPTWSGGLDRLVLAHAFGASDAVCQDTASEPLDPMADPAWLGAIGELQSLLADARRDCERPRSVAAWSRWMTQLLEAALVCRDANSFEHAAVRDVLFRMGKAAASAEFDLAVPFEAVRECVRRALETSPPPQGFLAGGVTFCELVPLRAIPFRIVAIVGLEDGAFPRARVRPGYDLIARDPLPSDRNPRDDDRHLFLEALLSARDRLVLTVPGRDLRDGSRLPPSVVVSELLDAIEASFRLDDASDPGVVGAGAALREWIVVEHPLQAVSPACFEAGGDPRLVGCDAQAFAGAQALWHARQAGGGDVRRFLDGRAPRRVRVGTPRSDPPHLSLDTLCERVLRSTRHFARERLGLRLPRVESAASDEDPIGYEALARYGLGEALLERLDRDGMGRDEALHRLVVHPLTPAGLVGTLRARELAAEMEELVQLASGPRRGERLADRSFTLVLEEVGALGPGRVSGTLDSLWPGGRVVLSAARIGRRSELDLWIRHLVLSVLVDEGLPLESTSTLIGRPSGSSGRAAQECVVWFPRVADARSRLATLFEWAWSVDEVPLPFFPKSSRVYAEKLASLGPRAAWREAHGTFLGQESSNRRTPERDEEPETRLVWEGVSPLEVMETGLLAWRFDELAEAFFAPLLEARRSGSTGPS